jgi:NAD(P)-dependent dehydrogenase (short-subunit alcohol dehydrogenase family)
MASRKTQGSIINMSSVKAVAPSTIASELAQKAVFTSDAAEARVLSHTPMRRLELPSEIAAAGVAGQHASSCVTGEIIIADGVQIVGGWRSMTRFEMQRLETH